jgi:hypothetical protein
MEGGGDNMAKSEFSRLFYYDKNCLNFCENNFILRILDWVVE